MLTLVIRSKMNIFKTIISIIFILLNSNAQALEIGIGLHPESFPNTPEILISELKKYHIKSFRTDYLWNEVEKTKGKYQPANEKTEKTIQLAKENNIKPLIIFGYGNELYEKFDPSNPKLKPTSDQSMQGYIDYVEWSTNHLKDHVSMYEIWNEWIEMDGYDKKNLTLSSHSAETYANLLYKSCSTIKKIQPNATVIGASHVIDASDQGTREWVMKVLNKKVTSCLDGISVHIYNYDLEKNLNSKEFINKLKLLHQGIIQKTGKSNFSIYVTEIGAPNPEQAKYTMNDSKKYFTQSISRISKLKYIKGVWWYDFINDGDNKSDKEHNFGILNRDLTPKPIALIFPQTIRKYQ